ncbi:MAG TPA: EamA family transporter [Candidatus Dormibacteraeota bacterium]|nr:EamA family transporter [Candidatus Dormibacteraeota bacterium]
MFDLGILFGLGSAAAWGAGDFVGGLAARRSGAIAVAAGATVVGFAVLLLVLAVIRPALPPPEVFVLGGLAGVAGGLGLTALYRGLSLGSMGLVAALSGVGSVLLPLVVGVWFAGDVIGQWQWVGIAAALAAGAAASGATLRGVNTAALSMALAAAIGFGLWYVILDRAAETHELWALVSSRGSSSVIVGGLAIARGGARGLRSSWRLVLTAGVLDLGGNGGFVLARGTLPVGIAAALSGLYPIATMLLARGVIGEALPRLGIVAVALAVAGIVLISLG